jgi:glycosyltransferase involved in cell wall biosynthesis
MTDRHVVSVIIPTVGREFLSSTQKALAEQIRPADEIIVVHDPHLRGPSWARNEGLRQARGDVIAFTDDDCLPPPDWLQRLIHALDVHNAAGAGGTYAEQDPLLSEIRLRRNFPLEERIDTFGWVVATGNVLYRRSWLEKRREHDGFVFDESVVSSQDADLALRIRELGGVLIYVPVFVPHFRFVSPMGFLKLQFFRGRGIADLYQIRKERPAPITHQASLLWGDGNRATRPRWATAVLRKVVGPFDRSGFSSFRHFALFWMGEKWEGAGFLWEILSRTMQRTRRRLAPGAK